VKYRQFLKRNRDIFDGPVARQKWHMAMRRAAVVRVSLKRKVLTPPWHVSLYWRLRTWLWRLKLAVRGK
jgi:hypothetical protein